jgi:hypothetical protein
MKNIILLTVLFFVVEKVNAVCSSPISRNNFNALQVLTATRLNTELNTVYTRANELPGDCITDESITSTQIDDGTIVNSDISGTAAILRSKLATPNYAISSSSGSFSSCNTTETDVTNLSVSLTTTGGLVEAYLVPATSSDSSVSITGSDSVHSGNFYLKRNTTFVGQHLIESFSGYILRIPSSVIRYFDTPTAGTYTYKITCQRGTNDTFAINHVRLVVREL